ncbi:MAG: hypothetical protein QNJ09_16080 [Paracoccaceae bacterium]|nr:hypothetical protein [Paracoccaceae bacterium]
MAGTQNIQRLIAEMRQTRRAMQEIEEKRFENAGKANAVPPLSPVRAIPFGGGSPTQSWHPATLPGTFDTLEPPPWSGFNHPFLSSSGVIQPEACRTYVHTPLTDDDARLDFEYFEVRLETARFRFGGEIEGNAAYGAAGIFKYTLPKAAFDGAAYWSVEQRIDIDEVQATNWAFFLGDSVARQCPDGADFPPVEEFFDSFGTAPFSILGAQGRDEFYTWPIMGEDRFANGFPLRQGVAPTIYVGIALFLWVRNGRLSLPHWSRALQYFSFVGPGLSYAYYRLPN